MYARPFIDSLDFARKGQRISGEVPIIELPRLLDVFVNPQSVLSYVVHGQHGQQDDCWLDIEVAGHGQLCCQRCLQSLDHSVQLKVRLMLREQAGMDALDDIEEEIDSILAEAQLDVLSLLEDEVLLSLPIAPRHEMGDCQAEGTKALQEELHPFAVLAKLKSN